MTSNTNSKPLTAWLWFAAATVVIGAFMLYPIGTTATNVAFILVKVGMLAGIIALMATGSTKAFVFWAVCSALAVVMTIIKWYLAGAFDWTFALAMATDVIVPSVGYYFLAKSRNSAAQ
jgi:hypothetical protein